MMVLNIGPAAAPRGLGAWGESFPSGWPMEADYIRFDLRAQ